MERRALVGVHGLRQRGHLGQRHDALGSNAGLGGPSLTVGDGAPAVRVLADDLRMGPQAHALLLQDGHKPPDLKPARHHAELLDGGHRRRLGVKVGGGLLGGGLLRHGRRGFGGARICASLHDAVRVEPPRKGGRIERPPCSGAICQRRCIFDVAVLRWWGASDAKQLGCGGAAVAPEGDLADAQPLTQDPREVHAVVVDAVVGGLPVLGGAQLGADLLDL
mmetsp:Transcript_57903/g.155075  ORF Transcript_57903/g.155075 Transcript_57903/m.155075 type:complete len:221 (-) Transcript_57903:386-1048(-)